jgi:hypothetical protein
VREKAAPGAGEQVGSRGLSLKFPIIPTDAAERGQQEQIRLCRITEHLKTALGEGGTQILGHAGFQARIQGMNIIENIE